jgi:hypothetical protein
MKSKTQKIAGFLLASFVTAAAWIAFWPHPQTAIAPSTMALELVVPETRWSRDRLASSITAVENADSDQARLDACSDLLQIPLTDLRELLEQVSNDERRLSLVTNTLLIRWAANDGEAAISWAWKRYRSQGLWDAAFREIIPSWAAHDPKGLAAWALEAADHTRPTSEQPRIAEIESMEHPLVDSRMLTDIGKWLVTEDPRLAYEILERRGGFSSEDSKIPLALTSVAKIQEALSVFKGRQILDPLKLRGEERHLYYLLNRWHQLDAEDFNRSSYAGSIIPQAAEVPGLALDRWKSSPAAEREQQANAILASVHPGARGRRIEAIAKIWAEMDRSAALRWLEVIPPEDQTAASAARISVLAAHDLNSALAEADRLPASAHRDCFVIAFDAWTHAHRGTRADQTGWPDEWAQAWADLEALQPQSNSTTGDFWVPQ